ncbi:TerC family protein [Cellulomonas sp. NPDC089187]|uniref:TerC family protein n=1 Tax=Cellulomonas sp. NPDC089187 TaxID=3154970 RepID=UPI00342ED96F
MDVSPLVWTVSIGLALAILFVDVAVVGRRPHVPSAAECLRYLGVYIGLALVFAGVVALVWGTAPAGEFVTGWLTEYSLSVDNLFVFLLIMTRFAVPRQFQQTALLVGIILALVFRGIFIALGAAVIEHFSWVFYLFGIFLVWTAIKVAREGMGDSEDEEYTPPALVRIVQRVLPTTERFDGVHLTARIDGRRVVTPMLLVLVAIGATDLLFAFDSIPAVFGVTQEPYLVLMANVFALMGLRQLYFLLGGLLSKLRYLNIGLGFLLGFIGVKLVFQALSENTLPFVNGGENVSWAPEPPVWVSLVVIVGILAITTVTSIAAARRDEQRASVGD